MTYSDIINNHYENKLFTVIDRSDANNDKGLALVDVLSTGYASIPVFRDLKRYDPMFLYIYDFVRLFGMAACSEFEFISLVDLNYLYDVDDINIEPDPIDKEWHEIVKSIEISE